MAAVSSSDPDRPHEPVILRRKPDRRKVPRLSPSVPEFHALGTSAALEPLAIARSSTALERL